MNTASLPADPFPMVVTAALLAYTAHGQDRNAKNGELYVNHPRRVATHAARLAPEHGLDTAETAIVIAACWLHDVVEDTDVTLADLAGDGVPAEVLEVVALLTKRPGAPKDDAYLSRIAAHRLARIAKLADLADNTDPDRMAVLSAKDQVRLAGKYAGYYAALGAEVPDHVAALAA